MPANDGLRELEMVMEHDGFTAAADEWVSELTYEEFKTASRFVGF